MDGPELHLNDVLGRILMSVQLNTAPAHTYGQRMPSLCDGGGGVVVLWVPTGIHPR